MPRDPAGNYSLPPAYFAQAGTTIRTEQHNGPMEDIAAALSGSLVRDGRNGMVGNLDMGTFLIRNVGKGTLATDAASVGQMVPIGSVIDYAGSTAPSGWFFCSGQAVNRSDYPELFAIIGTSYGSPDGLTFNLPDLRGRVVAGRDDMGGADAGRLSVLFGALARTLGGAFGTAFHVLSLAEMPSHNHGGVTTSAGAHAHGGGTSADGNHGHGATASTNGSHDHAVFNAVVNGTGNGGLPTGGNLGITTAPTTSAGAHSHAISIEAAGLHSHTLTTDTHPGHTHAITSQGSSNGHTNTQPTMILNKIIKALY